MLKAPRGGRAEATTGPFFPVGVADLHAEVDVGVGVQVAGIVGLFAGAVDTLVKASQAGLNVAVVGGVRRP